MSSPNRRISPVMRASGFSSCIRLSARKNVDLPQPLGPMMAVTALAVMSIETFLTAARSPKKTERSRIVSADVLTNFESGEKDDCISVADMVFQNFNLNASEPVARQKTHADVDDQHKHDQHERPGPGLPVPVVIR